MYDVVVIGAGAAGLMAAGTAAGEGKRVLLIEKMEKAGRKIRITGKGRCNLTNVKPREEFLAKVRAGRDFFEPAYDAFDNEALIEFFRDEGVKLTVERGGRVFPASEKAWDIAEAMKDFATDNGAEIMYNTKVTGIRTVGRRVSGVSIITKQGFPRNIECRNVIICTGGVSYPATGSTGDGYHMAHSAGHTIEEVRPSLVPLISHSLLAESLAGVQLKNVGVTLVADGEPIAREFGEMEFSKRGIEGAVILRLSRAAVDALIDEHKVEIAIDLKSALDEETLQARFAREMEALEEGAEWGDVLRKLMPKPMIAPFAREIGTGVQIPAKNIGEEAISKAISALKGLRVPIDDYGTFEQAVVTAGGVSVSEVDPQTMQSKLIKGLYFAGEVLDIDADTGGYNLQVAFSTGRLAGKLF